MNRIYKWAPFALALLFLSGCGTGSENNGSASTEDTADVSTTDTASTADTSSVDTSNEDTSSDTADSTNGQEEDQVEYYRLHYPDHLYVFAGEGNEFASYTSYPQFVTDRYIQFSENNGGTQTVRIYEYTDDEIREVFVRNETYFRENFIERLDELESEQPTEIILQEPLETGHSWESPSGTASEMTDVKAFVDIPFGEFEALEVTRTMDETTMRQYYIHEIGLIQSEFENADGSTVTSYLERVEEGPEEQVIQVYHPDEQALELTSSEMTLQFQTNDATRDILAEALKNIPDYGGTGLIGPNVEVRSLYLNQDGRVYVDFSQELVDEMNAGSGVEMMILQGIVNTIGGYYGVEEVYLTVEGEPYESGHIVMQEGEFWPVDLGSTED